MRNTAVIEMPQPDRVASKAWLRHGIALALLLLALLMLFRASIATAVEVWWISPTYSHCFLIIPIVAWLIWEKRGALGKLEPQVAPTALLALPFLALAWWLGQLSAINEVQQYAVVAMMQALFVALLGVNVLRLIWFPVLYLLFLVPTGEYLIVPMQNFATHFVDVSLTLLGIPHYTEGTTFELTNGRYEIAEACAGLRFLIATVTLGVLFSHMMYRKFYKSVLFLIACVAVPLVGNGLRCVGIIVLAHFTSNKYGAGADHIVYGWGFNAAILLVLGVVGSMFRDDVGGQDAAVPARTGKSNGLIWVTALAAGLICTGPALAWWHDNNSVTQDLTAITKPFPLAGWHEVPASPSWRPGFPGVDAQASVSVVPAGESAAVPVDLYIGYYTHPRPGHSMAARVNRLWSEHEWTLSDASAVMAPLAGNRVRFQEWIVTSPAQKRVIWFSYWVNGRFTTSAAKAKLLQAGAALQGHEGQAAIAFSTVMDSTVEEARARLARALLALNQLPARLDQANNQAGVR